jgi:hypothetical protein
MADEFFNIASFRDALASGAKPNLFRCSINPSDELASNVDGLDVVFASDTGTFPFLCRSAAVPAYTLGVIEVPFRGRRIKVPGDRTYADWTVTVINDEGQQIRKAFSNWMNYINAFNGEEALRSESGDYRCTIRIEHLRADGSISRVYELYDAFPTDLGAIDLNYDTVDAIQEFTVSFQYHHMEAGGVSEAGTDAGDPDTTA